MKRKKTMKKTRPNKRVFVGDFPIGAEEKKAINDVLDAGRISEWRQVRLFEKNWAKYCGTKYGVAVNSGTSALIVALAASDKLSRDKLFTCVTTPITYIATINSLLLNDIEPIFADIDERTFCITPETVRAAIDNEPYEIDAILPVHLGGYPCDMGALADVAKENDAYLFEDSAQAHGTIIDGKRTGSFGEWSIFSFYIAHNIQAGELGIVLTNNEAIAKMVRQLKSNGRACDCLVCTRGNGHCPKIEDYEDPRFTHEYVGWNFKAMEFQAALANVQIPKADDIIKRRQKNVKCLNDLLEDSVVIDYLVTPLYDKNVSYLSYILTIQRDAKNINRKDLCTYMESMGIENRPLYGCLPLRQPSLSKFRYRYKNKLPVAEYIGDNAFYVGCHQYLNETDMHYIANVLKKYFRSVKY